MSAAGRSWENVSSRLGVFKKKVDFSFRTYKGQIEVLESTEIV